MIKTISFLLISLLLIVTPDKNTSKPKEKILTLKQQEKNIVWTVTEGEANTIISGLNELPAKVANPLIQKLILQAQKQLTDTIPKNK